MANFNSHRDSPDRRIEKPATASAWLQNHRIAPSTPDRRSHVTLGQYDSVMTFTAAITHEGEWFVARCLEVEVTSQGDSVESALTNLKEALELYFEDGERPTVVENPLVTTFQLTA